VLEVSIRFCREQRVEIAVRVTFWLASALTGYDLEEASSGESRIAS
jgi:hypothetical protein